MKTRLFKSVTRVMGYPAAWFSSVQGISIPATLDVTFKAPSYKEREYLEINGVIFEPDNVIIEYFEGDFTGLKEAAGRDSSEYITVNKGTSIVPLFEVYEVQQVIKMWDGSVYWARCVLSE